MRSASSAFFLAVYTLLAPTYAADHSHSGGSIPSKKDVCAIDPSSIVTDACASFSTLDSLNKDIQPSIDALTSNTDFFSYYRLNLFNKECPFWNDESSLCGNIACAVNTIEKEEDIPPLWRAEELSKLQGPKAHHPSRQLQKERETKPLQGELGDDVGESCVVEYDDECDERDYCVPEDESATAKGDYVSLVDNPERFTGYSGPGAHQVWEAIYRENCFPTDGPASSSSSLSSPFGGLSSGGLGLRNMALEHEKQQILHAIHPDSQLEESSRLDDQCLEKRTFYRIISGMHASISSHLCWDYLNQTTGQWGPNVGCYERRLRNFPDRISNLYFNYAVVLRAIAKARSALTSYTFCSGDPVQDRSTKQKVLALADKIANGPQIYDESLMFQDPALKEDFRNRFRNVSRTMDCVGCDKCRLWGKLQTAGYGTALKILFEFDEDEPSNNQLLRRTEVVALINTLGKISHAITALEKFHAMSDEAKNPTGHKTHQPVSVKANVDDGFGEARKQPEPSVMEAFWDEWDLVWKTTKWVLSGWVQIPSALFQILLVNFAKAWAWFIGIEGPQGASWTFRPPPGMAQKEL